MRPAWASRSFATWAIARSLLARRARPSEERTQWRCPPRSSAFFPADVVQREISMLDVQLRDGLRKHREAPDWGEGASSPQRCRPADDCRRIRRCRDRDALATVLLCTNAAVSSAIASRPLVAPRTPDAIPPSLPALFHNQGIHL